MWSRRLSLGLVVLGFLFACSPDGGTGGETGAVSGHVYQVGTPIPLSGVRVWIGNNSATTTLDGAYALEGVATGSRTLEASLAGFHSYAQQISVGSGTNAADIQLTPVAGSLTGVVRNYIGQAIQSADVRIAGLATRTDAAGRYQFSSLPPGRYQLQVDAGSYQSFVESLLVSPPETQFDVRLIASLVPPPDSVWGTKPHEATNGTIRVQWSATPPSPVRAGYRVYRSSDSLSYQLITAVLPNSPTEYTDVGRTWGRYWYRVVSVNLDGMEGAPRQETLPLAVPFTLLSINFDNGVCRGRGSGSGRIRWRANACADTVRYYVATSGGWTFTEYVVPPSDPLVPGGPSGAGYSARGVWGGHTTRWFNSFYGISPYADIPDSIFDPRGALINTDLAGLRVTWALKYVEPIPAIGSLDVDYSTAYFCFLPTNEFGINCEWRRGEYSTRIAVSERCVSGNTWYPTVGDTANIRGMGREFDQTACWTARDGSWHRYEFVWDQRVGLIQLKRDGVALYRYEWGFPARSPVLRSAPRPFEWFANESYLIDDLSVSYWDYNWRP